MRIISLVIALLILLFGVTFAILNADRVAIDFYFGTAHLPLSLLLAIALIIGVGLGLLTALVWLVKSKAKQRHLARQLHKTEKELEKRQMLPDGVK